MPGCLHCDRAKAWLDARGIPYATEDHPDPAERLRFYAVVRHRSMPVAVLDGDVIGGADELAVSGIESLFRPLPRGGEAAVAVAVADGAGIVAGPAAECDSCE